MSFAQLSLFFRRGERGRKGRDWLCFFTASIAAYEMSNSCSCCCFCFDVWKDYQKGHFQNRSPFQQFVTKDLCFSFSFFLSSTSFWTTRLAAPATTSSPTTTLTPSTTRTATTPTTGRDSRSTWTRSWAALRTRWGQRCLLWCPVAAAVAAVVAVTVVVVAVVAVVSVGGDDSDMMLQVASFYKHPVVLLLRHVTRMLFSSVPSSSPPPRNTTKTTTGSTTRTTK